MVPARVAALAGADTTKLVWRNELGGLTFRVAAGTAGERYVKWVAAGTPELDLPAEAERLAWASRWAAVPQVLEAGSDADGTWLVTRPVPAVSAIDDRWRGDVPTVITAIGRGLRTLHDALPVAGCPFGWAVERRRERFEERIADGEGPADWSEPYRSLSVAQARALLADTPPVDRLVVCHGDACVPNTLLDDTGAFAAHVDLGSLGVADRWADIAVAAWSLDVDFGPAPDHEAMLCSAYGIEPDHNRLAYYRMLWDLC